MENLYHQTNRLVLETQELFNRLESSKSEAIEAEIQSKILTISKNCEQLVVLVHKEPVSRRNNAKLRVDQLKYDYQHLQIALKTHQQNVLRRLRAEQEREELLNRRFTRNSDINDTTILIDHTIQHQNSLQGAHRGVDDLLGSGVSILQSLRDQRDRLTSTRNRLSGIFGNLRLSNTTMKYIEKRLKEDRYILYSGMAVTILIIIIVMMYFS
ncbi:probable Golgi SNAP receptor complex member 2 [Adelges cooleyi]|uniref:probable Golgi SNAP receptor complex member 2 n=1 Tax=Adelges cooleyi TaxID=133065 RepID=UPI002180240B|nr:probable Golgi SNAP receptor complex member 2 [Adelges cooleyi]